MGFLFKGFRKLFLQVVCWEIQSNSMEVPAQSWKRLSLSKREGPKCCITTYHTKSSTGLEKDAEGECYNQGVFPQSRCNASCGPRFYAARKKSDNNGLTLPDGDISSHPMVTVGLTEVEGECKGCTKEVIVKTATHRSDCNARSGINIHNLGPDFTHGSNSGLNMEVNAVVNKGSNNVSNFGSNSMSNCWSDTNLTNHGSSEFSLPLSPTINGMLSCPKDIDTKLNAGNDDSSPIIAPINSNSQQSQRQVFNTVNISNKEKLSTSAIEGNEPNQSNRPPHCKRTLHQLWNPSFVELIPH